MNLMAVLRSAAFIAATASLLSSCGTTLAQQSSQAAASTVATRAAAKVESPAVTLPTELIGVWSSDDADGRAQCDRYRALPADVSESDDGTSLIGSVVITPSMIHQYSEYGEGNFYAVRGVETLGVGIRKVVVQLGIDAIPTAEDRSRIETHRLEVRQGKLSWESEAPTEDRAYFRCGDIRRDVYQVE
jgi:hypothetical protein